MANHRSEVGTGGCYAVVSAWTGVPVSRLMEVGKPSS